MNLTQFVKSYVGTKVDFDGAYGAQCVDLYRRYCSSVLEIPQTPPVVGAKDIITKPGVLSVKKESATTNYVAGDILIWGATATNQFGHVAVLVAALDESNFIVVEQDGFRQDGVRLMLRSRENLLGGLYKA